MFNGFDFKPPVTICINNGIIEKIFTNSNYKLKAKNVIDGSGKTLMPGLINAHIHFSSIKNNLKEAAQAGVLTVLNLFEPNIELNKDSMKLFKNSANYASYLSAGICVTAPGGHGTQFGFKIPTITRPEDADKFIRDRINEGSDFIKIILENGTGQLPCISDSVLIAIVKACKKYNKLCLVHISTIQNAIKAFDAGADGLAHIWYRDSSFISDVQIERFRQRKFFIIPTLTLKENYINFQKQKNNGVVFPYTEVSETVGEISKLYKNYIPLLGGTDAPNLNINFGSDLYREINFFLKANLTPEDALKTVTSTPAKTFNLYDRGIIEVGKRADLLLIRES